jgi:hypothetical protein
VITVIMYRVCWREPATVIGRRPPFFPILSIDSLHSKADISYLPARPCVYQSAVCRITSFLQLLQSDGALYLDLSVLLQLSPHNFA